MKLELENKLFRQGIKKIGALDEVGRGPLAGPVVSACVVIEGGQQISERLLKTVMDSKCLSEKKREILYDEIHKEFFCVGVGSCDHTTIDRINILQAAFLSMKKAIGKLNFTPDYLLVDGKFSIPNISTPQQAIVSGDSLIFSIAAASIVAKVIRDRIMRGMNDVYPEYGFDRHKGYGTKIHLEALEKFGPCPIHRQSFKPVARYIKS